MGGTLAGKGLNKEKLSSSLAHQDPAPVLMGQVQKCLWELECWQAGESRTGLVLPQGLYYSYAVWLETARQKGKTIS